MTEYETCRECGGGGSVSDTTMGIVMGAALGMGYFPSTKTCPTCWGSGRTEKR